MRRSAGLPGSLVVAALLLSAAPVRAADGCKVKVDAKSGAIQVSATKVGGVLTWGDGPGPFAANNAFANAATCVADGKAKKCELGAAGTPEQITPPQLCRIFLRDSGGDECSAFIKGCTPGVRVVPDVPDPPPAEGGAKAGAVVRCTALGSEVAVLRSFNNVNGGAITIDDGTLPGRCEVTFPFGLESRYYSVEPISFVSTVATYKVDYEVSGSTITIGGLQYLAPSWQGQALDVSILIF